MQTRVEATGAVILTLIGGTYGSDAAFERACGLPPKSEVARHAPDRH